MVDSEVKDVRGFESGYSFEKQGFQWVNWSSAQKTWDDDEEIKEIYYPDCEELLKKATGASHAFAFNHVQRANDWAEVMKDSKSQRATYLPPREPGGH